MKKVKIKKYVYCPKCHAIWDTVDRYNKLAGCKQGHHWRVDEKLIIRTKKLLNLK